MLSSTIRDYKGDALAQYQALKSALSQHEYADSLQEIQSSFDRVKPSLMFYGIYNAGKSSLLNAIFGESVASVNDIPETHKVTEYTWKTYTLADTPGINGPREDEKITLQEIRRHDIIMFVIDDSDNFDSDIITRRIVEIIEAKKPCLIVINRKNDRSDEEISRIRAKMKQNIEKLTDAEHAYEFFDVDARAALRAKQENKSLLLQDSKISELEYRISKRLLEAEGVLQLRVPLDLTLRFYLCTLALLRRHQ